MERLLIISFITIIITRILYVAFFYGSIVTSWKEAILVVTIGILIVINLYMLENEKAKNNKFKTLVVFLTSFVIFLGVTVLLFIDDVNEKISAGINLVSSVGTIIVATIAIKAIIESQKDNEKVIGEMKTDRQANQEANEKVIGEMKTDRHLQKLPILKILDPRLTIFSPQLHHPGKGAEIKIDLRSPNVLTYSVSNIGEYPMVNGTCCECIRWKKVTKSSNEDVTQYIRSRRHTIDVIPAGVKSDIILEKQIKNWLDEDAELLAALKKENAANPTSELRICVTYSNATGGYFRIGDCYNFDVSGSDRTRLKAWIKIVNDFKRDYEVDIKEIQMTPFRQQPFIDRLNKKIGLKNYSIQMNLKQKPGEYKFNIIEKVKYLEQKEINDASNEHEMCGVIDRRGCVPGQNCLYED